MNWVILNVWPTALHTLVAGLVAFALATFVTAPLRRQLTRMEHKTAKVQDQLDPSTPGGIQPLTAALTRIADELDTSTPGGLTALIDELKPIVETVEDPTPDDDRLAVTRVIKGKVR